MALRGRKRSTQLQQCHRKAAAAGCLSFKEFWGVQFEKGCFLFRLQRVFGQWRNSWGASLPAIYILHPLCEAQTFNGTFPQLEIYCAAACLLVHNRAKPFWKIFYENQAVGSLISLTYLVSFCLGNIISSNSYHNGLSTLKAYHNDYMRFFFSFNYNFCTLHFKNSNLQIFIDEKLCMKL